MIPGFVVEIVLDHSSYFRPKLNGNDYRYIVS